MASRQEPASVTVNELLDRAMSASLGTILSSGGPFVSLVNFARHSRTELVMLLSGLAVHTQNLGRDHRCSMLIASDPMPGIDPLTLPRVTLTGTAVKLVRTDDAEHREKMIARHPSSAMYADFGDFAIFKFEIEEAHLVAGFGRIQSVTADAI